MNQGRTTAPYTSETDISVPTALGPLHGIISAAPTKSDGAPGLVLVDGSGDGDRHSWGDRPALLAAAGAVVLRHDKPGCGGSPGHWMSQTLEDRARETLAAVAALRAHRDHAARPVGLYGVSQGGWVALLAAALEPGSVDFVICHSAPGTTPAAQERERLHAWLIAHGMTDAELHEALAWVDERAEQIMRGEPAESILALQQQFVDRRWYDIVRIPYDSPGDLSFLRGMLDFDPKDVIPRVTCPVLALFGSADDMIPVAASVSVYAEHLPAHEGHGLMVFPHADHGLRVPDELTSIERAAPGYGDVIAGFLARHHARPGHTAS